MTPDDGQVDRVEEDPGDEVLLQRVARGDHDAFAQLVERHRDMVMAVCWRFFRNDSDAQDAMQDAFLALYRGASSFSGAARVSTWLYRIATNSCHDIARKRVRRPQPSGIDPTWLPAAADDEIAALELDLDLRDALTLLRPEHREVIVMHALRGMTYAEIAEATGVALGTVKSRIHRAHVALAAVLGDAGREQADAADRQMPDTTPPPR